ncbi:MAG: hypothetical protein CVU18_18420 [Betaproteobacteria bacterium HGW-Betaproteobacteria-12]|nr:MAG: hypothetical protein CVU18_18420 [Betaproteobacteria bacterium HGW-Betaproteobacteria-12]
MEAPPLPLPNELAPIKARIFAYLIDLSIGVVALLFAKLLLSKSPDNVLAILSVFVSLAIVLGVIAYQAVLLSSTGQTIGKRAMRLRIVTFSEASNPGFAKAVLIRWWLISLLCTIPYLGWMFWLADGLFMFRQERRCLHDLIADTKVIQQV